MVDTSHNGFKVPIPTVEPTSKVEEKAGCRESGKGQRED